MKRIHEILDDCAGRILDAEIDATLALRDTLTCGGVPESVAKHYLAYRESGRRWVLLHDGDNAGTGVVRIVSEDQIVAEVKRREGIQSDYTKAPWRESSKELPSGSGMRCVCFVPMLGCEVEMIFHRSRPGSGYMDFFTECAAGNRAYDWDRIKYWRYYTDKVA